jgi:hypothetical protein
VEVAPGQRNTFKSAAPNERTRWCSQRLQTRQGNAFELAARTNEPGGVCRGCKPDRETHSYRHWSHRKNELVFAEVARQRSKHPVCTIPIVPAHRHGLRPQWATRISDKTDHTESETEQWWVGGHECWNIGEMAEKEVEREIRVSATHSS